LNRDKLTSSKSTVAFTFLLISSFATLFIFPLKRRGRIKAINKTPRMMRILVLS